jgi:2'-5' RNA ligase
VLSGAVEGASSLSSGMTWVKSSHFHVTLVFLGEQEETLLPILSDALQEVASVNPSFQLKIGEMGGFPNLEKPKVVFASVGEGKQSLRNLAGRISESLEMSKVKFDKKEFHAHVTLGRVKSLKNIRETVERFQVNWPFPAGEMNVQGFTLFQSRLTSEGPVYQALKEFTLRQKI